MEPKDSFTICVLLYGDHTNLGHRCLSSLARACPDALPTNLRVGLNEVSSRTDKYVASLVENGWLLEDNIWRSAENIHKYPMMRRMIYDPDRPVETPYVMWFDDDSYIKEDQVGATPDFLTNTLGALDPCALDPQLKSAAYAMCGAVYTLPLEGRQKHWIEDQSWFGHKPVRNPARFATGGWWAAKYEMLKKFNYPWPELDHRGGDVMLGQLLDQQGITLTNFRKGVAINADENGNESKAARRGFNQPPLGKTYVRGAASQVASPPEPVLPVQPPRKIIRLIDGLDL